MDVVSSTDDDASHPQLSDEDGEGPREGMPPLDENDEEEEEEGEENDDKEAFMRRRIKGNDEKDDGEDEGNCLQQVDGSNELGLLRKNEEHLF